MANRLAVMGLGLAAAIGLTVFGGSLRAQITKGKTRLAATKYLMRGIQQPNCKSLGQLLKGDGPADEKAWDAVACHASCLNEMGHLLMADGRCPDAVWAGAAKNLREGSAAVVAAAGKQDLQGARDAFKTVTASCAACHKAHR